MSIGRSATPSSRKGPGRHTRRGPRTVLGLTCGSMSRTKRALWNLVLDSTARSDDLPMRPGTPPFFLAKLVWGSVFLDYLSHFSLIPSRLTNAISEAYERHLLKQLKPQNASFPNQYLQEHGGETTASLSSAIYMADPSSNNKERSLVVVVPVGLPPELHQCAPEYFLVVDSGATVHCLWDAMS